MEENLIWERIYSNSGDISYAETYNIETYRAKVFCGWIVRNLNFYIIIDNGKKNISQSQSMVFVPDLKHEWKIDNESY